MKILSFINISNPASLETDSSVIIHRILRENYRAMGHSFWVASPVVLPHDLSDIVIDIGSEIQKYAVRFSFPWGQVADCLQKNQPDVILVHQVEWAQKIRAVMTSIDLQCRIISYAHYMPMYVDSEGKLTIDGSLNNNGLGESVFFEFLAGIAASDRVFVQSRYAKSILDSSYVSIFLDQKLPSIDILPPPRDPLIVNVSSTDIVAVERRVKTIVYNHRLYAHYGNAMLREHINRFRNYEWVICDVMPLRSDHRAALDTSVTEMKQWLSEQPNVRIVDVSTNRAAYVEILSTARFVMAAHRKNAVWSMSCVDAMSLGTPVIAPRFGAYPEFIPEDELYHTKERSFSIIETLMTDDALWQFASNMAREQAEVFDPVRFAQALVGIESV